MTLPTSYSWLLHGARLTVPYQAPAGRRVNAIGASVTHGPEAGRLEYQRWAVLPHSRAKRPRTTPAERAAAQGLPVDEVGPIDAERVVAFLWRVAGRPVDAAADWQRERPLMIALDNYAVHTSQTVAAARPQLARAGVELAPLARYCPEQSGIEPVWNDIKQHDVPTRSFAQVTDLKHAVDAALARKAAHLHRVSETTTDVHHLST